MLWSFQMAVEVGKLRHSLGERVSYSYYFTYTSEFQVLCKEIMILQVFTDKRML